MTDRSNPLVEFYAKAIYGAMEYDGPGEKPEWVPNGNSLKQDEARRYARAVIASLSVESHDKS
jgi:hypothetical protein